MKGLKNITCSKCNEYLDPDYFSMQQLATDKICFECLDYQRGENDVQEVSYAFYSSQSEAYQEGYRDAWYRAFAPTGGYMNDDYQTAWDNHVAYMPEDDDPVNELIANEREYWPTGEDIATGACLLVILIVVVGVIL